MRRLTDEQFAFLKRLSISQIPYPNLSEAEQSIAKYFSEIGDYRCSNLNGC